MKICHITTVHKQNDIRIFLKECSSLAKLYETHLIVINGQNSTLNNVHIHGVQVEFSNRLQRFTKAVRSAYLKAVEINADIYHIHDPELLRITRKLKRQRKKVNSPLRLPAMTTLQKAVIITKLEINHERFRLYMPQKNIPALATA